MAPAAPSTYNNYIDGRWVPSATNRTFENRNPADTTTSSASFSIRTRADVDAAIAAAAPPATTSPLPAPVRAEMLFKAAQLIADRRSQYARDMTREMGKVSKRDTRATCRRPST